MTFISVGFHVRDSRNRSRRLDRLRLSRLDFTSVSNSDPASDHVSVQTHRQLRHRHHSVHDCYLLALLSAQVALFKINEESAEACAADERAARENEGNEAE